MDLNGKVALVTGGGVGIGRAVALMLAREGCHVAVNYSRSQAEAEATVRDVCALGVRAVAAQADVADDGAVRDMLTQTEETLGRLDLLVNNAGTTAFISHDDLDGVSDDTWDAILGVNLKGPFYVIRAALPQLRANRGTIVNVSSIAGVYGAGSSLPYCASKAGLNMMTLVLARALAPEIRVNAVAPGFTDTRWWQERDGYEGIKQFASERSPLKRVCQPEDVAVMVIALAKADLVTGQVVVIDGGMGLVR